MCFREVDKNCRVCGKDLDFVDRFCFGSRYSNKRYCSINCSLMYGAWRNFILAILSFLAVCIVLLVVYTRVDTSYYDLMVYFLVIGSLAAILAGLSVVGFNLRRAEGY